MKVAFITSYPSSELLPVEQVRGKYINNEHNVPWVRLLAEAISSREDVDLRVFIYGRAVMKHVTVEKNGVIFEFVPKRIPARFEPYNMYLSAYGDLAPYVSRYTPDIVVGFGTETGNAQAAVKLPYPSVIFVQGILARLDPYLDSNWLKSKLGLATEESAIKRADGVVLESNFANKWVSEISSKTDVCVIPHPLDTNFLDVEARHSQKSLLCVGRMYGVKGTDIVLKAFARCDDKASRLKMLGHGHEEYTALVKELGISGRVDFQGRVSPDVVRQEMSKARALVIGSRMDTSPNVVTEAHAAGLPVIGTRAGGIPEMIDDGKDGYIVKVNDVEAMSARMNEFLSDAVLCKKMGSVGKEKVRNMNDTLVVASKHIEFYRKIISSE